MEDRLIFVIGPPRSGSTLLARMLGAHSAIHAPAEPHLLTPFVHYLPRRLQSRLLRRFTLWGWIARPSPEQVERFVRDTRLLTHREMQSLFPDCEIRRERFLGFTKSYVAVR